MKQLFCFSCKRKNQNLDFFLRIYFDLSLSLSFSPFFSFFIGGFVAHFIAFLLLEIVAG